MSSPLSCSTVVFDVCALYIVSPPLICIPGRELRGNLIAESNCSWANSGVFDVDVVVTVRVRSIVVKQVAGGDVVSASRYLIFKSGVI